MKFDDLLPAINPIMKRALSRKWKYAEQNYQLNNVVPGGLLKSKKKKFILFLEEIEEKAFCQEEKVIPVEPVNQVGRAGG